MLIKNFFGNSCDNYAQLLEAKIFGGIGGSRGLFKIMIRIKRTIIGSLVYSANFFYLNFFPKGSYFGLFFLFIKYGKEVSFFVA
jgi:hypothetical protein